MFCYEVPFNKPGLGLTRGQLTTILSDYVAGPASSTDNAIARFDGTTGELIQNSNVTIDDSGNMVVAGNLTISGTTTTINSTILDVTDKNITVNKGGSTALSSLSGVNIEGDSGLVVGFFRSASDSSNFEIKAPTGNTLTFDINADKTLTVGGSLNITGDSTLSGTNTGNVTLSGENYLSLTGQALTASAINLAGSNVTGTLPVAHGGLGGATTSDLSEGSNLYYTNARADARITAQKGFANGLATLDSGGKIPTSQLPALALTDVYTVSSQVAQLALTAEEGDVAIRTDLNKSYIHNGGTSGTIADWSELLTPTDTVLSVNGMTGAVTLTTSNISEGLNLYFTDERAQDAVGNILTDTSTIDFTYNDAGNQITADVITNSIGNSLLRQSSGLSIIGRSASSTGDVADITASTDNQVLRRSGSSLGFGAINLASTNAVTGVLPETNGGTGQGTYTLGDIPYASAANTLSKLAGNTANTLKVLTQTGNGTISAAPVWAALSSFGVSSAAGTANQINTSASTGAVTLSLSSTLLAPGTVGVTSTLAVGSPYAGVRAPLSNGALIAGNTGIGTGWSFISPNAITDIYQDYFDTSKPTLHTLGVGTTISTYGATSNPLSISAFTTGANPGTPTVVGYSFTTSSTLYVTQLGALTYAPLNIFTSGSSTIGLYNNSGTLLASVTVSSAGTPVNNFIYGNLTSAVAIPAGTYVILATYSTFYLSFSLSYALASPFTYGSTITHANQSSLSYYTGNDQGSIIAIGPNLTYALSQDTVITNSSGLLVNTTSTVLTTPAAPLHFQVASTSPSGELGSLMLQGTPTSVPSNPRLIMGLNYTGSTQNYSYIQSVENGVLGRPLVLQPLGGSGASVMIGTTTAATAFCRTLSSVGFSTHFNYALTGTAIDGSTDTEGIVLGLCHNATGNRQAMFGDSAKMASSSSNGLVRVIPGGSSPSIDAIATDASTLLTLQVGNSTGGVYSPGKMGVGVVPSSSTCTLAVSGATQISANTTLPAATNTNLYLGGNYGSPVLGRLYIGDGTGWYFQMAKRTGSTDTALFYFKDSGNFGIGIDPTSPLHLNGDMRVQGYALIRWTDTTGNNGLRFVGSHMYSDSDVFSTRDLVLGVMTAASTYTDVVTITSTKSVLLQAAALATNATDGFTYIPTCAGTPTGTPTSQTGVRAMVYDTTNNKLYVYNSAWKSVTLT